jgi:uncharacterized membrane protein
LRKRRSLLRCVVHAIAIQAGQVMVPLFAWMPGASLLLALLLNGVMDRVLPRVHVPVQPGDGVFRVVR